MVAANCTAVDIAYSPADIARLKRAGKKAILLGIENGYAIGKNLSLLEHFAKRGIDARNDSIALRRHSQIGCRLGKIDTTFRVTYNFGRTKSGFGHQNSLWVRIAHVFTRENKHTARNEFRVFPTVYHAGEPVQSRVGIATAH